MGIDIANDVIIQTKNLILRYYNHADKTEVSILASDTDVMRYVFKGPISYEHFERFVKYNFVKPYEEIGLAVLCLKESNKVIGIAGLHKLNIEGEEVLEIGFVISKDYQGRGFGPEIGLAQVDLCKKLGYNEVYATVHPANKSSIIVLGNKLGFKRSKKQLQIDRDERLLYYKAI